MKTPYAHDVPTENLLCWPHFTKMFSENIFTQKCPKGKPMRHRKHKCFRLSLNTSGFTASFFLCLTKEVPGLCPQLLLIALCKLEAWSSTCTGKKTPAYLFGLKLKIPLFTWQTYSIYKNTRSNNWLTVTCSRRNMTFSQFTSVRSLLKLLMKMYI